MAERVRVVVLAAIVALAASGPCAAASRAYRLASALNAELLSRPSASRTLERWCAARRLADPPTVTATRIAGPDKPASAEARQLLHADADEPIRYRRVSLGCGGHVLSRADNWYRPGLLTAAMNAELETTDHPFGVVVKALGFQRLTLQGQLLVPRRGRVPAVVLRHQALLETPDGTPFSLVVEAYGREVLR